jgi:hypothetical protein
MTNFTFNTATRILALQNGFCLYRTLSPFRLSDFLTLDS